MRKTIRSLIISLLLTGLANSVQASADSGPPFVEALMKALRGGQSQSFLVQFDTSDIDDRVDRQRRERGLSRLDAGLLSAKVRGYAQRKGRIYQAMDRTDFRLLRDYDELPLAHVQVDRPETLTRLLAQEGVLEVFRNQTRQRMLTESLPLINQPAAEANGFTGAGTAVAVIDSGVDYTRPAFGSCSSPGVPAGCRVVFMADFAPDDGMLDDSVLHGTNVAGIVLGVAPEASIVGLDVFGRFSANDSDILAAVDWAIAHQADFNIVALNLSLGGGVFRSPCYRSAYGPAFMNARAVGIIPVVASGNEDLKSALGEPACVPQAVSVGAVYDSNMGPVYFGTCSDPVTYADLVTCYSNSAYYLTMLAPGDEIVAAGVTQGGTSQATPHVAGAIAALRSVRPSENLSTTVLRMTTTGVPVTDPRNGITKPRLDLNAAALTGSVDGPDYVASWSELRQLCFGASTNPLCLLIGTLRITNQGSQDAVFQSTASFYRSADTALSGADTLLRSINFTPLQAGVSLSLRFFAILPRGQNAAGEYVIARVDAKNAIDERIEGNNIAAAQAIP